MRANNIPLNADTFGEIMIVNGNKLNLNILMFGHKTMPARDSSRGGVEVVVEELSTRMAKRGHCITLLNRSGCDNGGLSEYKGVKLKKVFTIRGKGLAAVSSSLAAGLKAAVGKYDIVHVHAEGACAWLWIPHLFGKKCVVTVHGLDWKREKWNLNFASKYIRLGEKTAVRYADEIIVLNRETQDYFKRTYNRETVYIPNAVSKPEIRDAKFITSRFGLRKDDYILFLGRLVPEKGVSYLIDAYKSLRTDKKLVVAGSASDTDKYVRSLMEKAAGSSIIFTGFVTGEIRRELYSNAYVYVLPSNLEGMPIALLEAMSYRNCCVVSDIPECTEVVEDNAVIFKTNDAENLREKLQMLCDDSKLVNEYRSKSADFIFEKYSWDDAADKTLELYQKVLR